jgi:hypothetical protein
MSPWRIFIDALMKLSYDSLHKGQDHSHFPRLALPIVLFVDIFLTYEQEWEKNFSFNSGNSIASAIA